MRVSTFYWDLFDLSKGNIKPMRLVVERRPEPISQTDLTDERRFQYDEYLFSLEGEYLAGAGDWQVAYRGTGTA